MDKPVIVVAINYRLNIFALGNLERKESNLALQDQKCAIEWVHSHIQGFDGDPVIYIRHFRNL
jgi:carboxylesterase type B